MVISPDSNVICYYYIKSEIIKPMWPVKYFLLFVTATIFGTMMIGWMALVNNEQPLRTDSTGNNMPMGYGSTFLQPKHSNTRSESDRSVIDKVKMPSVTLPSHVMAASVDELLTEEPYEPSKPNKPTKVDRELLAQGVSPVIIERARRARRRYGVKKDSALAGKLPDYYWTSEGEAAIIKQVLQAKSRVRRTVSKDAENMQTAAHSSLLAGGDAAANSTANSTAAAAYELMDFEDGAGELPAGITADNIHLKYSILELRKAILYLKSEIIMIRLSDEKHLDNRLEELYKISEILASSFVSSKPAEYRRMPIDQFRQNLKSAALDLLSLYNNDQESVVDIQSSSELLLDPRTFERIGRYQRLLRGITDSWAPIVARLSDLMMNHRNVKNTDRFFKGLQERMQAVRFFHVQDDRCITAFHFYFQVFFDNGNFITENILLQSSKDTSMNTKQVTTLIQAYFNYVRFTVQLNQYTKSHCLSIIKYIFDEYDKLLAIATELPIATVY